MHMNDCLSAAGKKEEVNREWIFNEPQFTFWGDENVWELDSGDGCATL